MKDMFFVVVEGFFVDHKHNIICRCLGRHLNTELFFSVFAAMAATVCGFQYRPLFVTISDYIMYPMLDIRFQLNSASFLAP